MSPPGRASAYDAVRAALHALLLLDAEGAVEASVAPGLSAHVGAGGGSRSS